MYGPVCQWLVQTLYLNVLFFKLVTNVADRGLNTYFLHWSKTLTGGGRGVEGRASFNLHRSDIYVTQYRNRYPSGGNSNTL